jgi:hypothetical protein
MPSKEEKENKFLDHCWICKSIKKINRSKKIENENKINKNLIKQIKFNKILLIINYNYLK